MIKVTFGGRRINSLIFVSLIWLAVFQSPLESVHRVFAYVDELMACIGIVCCAVVFLNRKALQVSKNTYDIIFALTIFAATGLLGNFMYQYQSVGGVLIDFFTSFKFFLTVSVGYYLVGDRNWKKMKKLSNRHAKIITAFLFFVFLVDRVFNFYPAEVRYGIKSAVLFYSHPTYLAGAMAFLLTLLTIFFEKSNIPYLAMLGIMMTFTLRSKAIASAIVFFALFFYFILLKKRLRTGHFVVIGAICLVVGWPLMNYYYIELAGRSARSVITSLSFEIMQDYFPIGTGFGTYASAAANESFSQVYEIYNLGYLLRFEGNWRNYLSDVFWPIIMAQTGFLGLLMFLGVMYKLGRRCLKTRNNDMRLFVGSMYIMCYLFVSSTSEPSFHNSIAIPLALLLGIVFRINNEYELLGLKEKS